MRFDSASSVEEVVWDMRISEQVRAADRAVLLRLYDGFPPFDKSTEEENNIQVNQNDLSGPNVLCQAGQQWNNAFLKTANFFNARPDTGPPHKRGEWGQIVTMLANRVLKRQPRMAGQIKATGKNTLIFGIGPTFWPTRRSIIPKPIPVGSLLIPSETEIEDLDDSLSYFAIFREYNAEQLYDMTHGPHVDPGWNMKLVQAQWEYIKDEMRKSPNSIAYQYMPERIEQLEKQDKGYLGSDAVPTCDVWDFYFREAENGKGWYRRIIVDWYVGDQSTINAKTPRPTSRNVVDDKSQFLYTSGKRKYANSLSEILQINFGDCSPYAPVKYHSLRGLGWMLWPVCELQNRLHCKFHEAVFEQLMWFFKSAGNTDLIRLRKANFEHMGIIPQGVAFLTPNERFTPNQPLLEMAFARNRQQISDASTSYVQGYDEGGSASPETATAVMAKVNASQTLASAILTNAAGQEAFKYREMLRRLMLKGSNDPIAREFRLGAIKEGVPSELLMVEKWDVTPEQILGGGNKTVQMAAVNFLNQIRKNLSPTGQRMVDNISVAAATDQPDLAKEMAPLDQDTPISNSTHDAQLATDRILRGLEFKAPKQAVFEDYVMVWLHDMGNTVQKIIQAGRLATPDELTGLANLDKHIRDFLDIMSQTAEGDSAAPEDKEKIRQLEDALGQLENHVKGLAQRLQQAMQAQQKAGAQGNGQGDGKREAALIMAQTKAQIAAQSAAQRTAQKQQQWEMGERRKDQQTAAEVQRMGVRTRHELLANQLKALAE